MPSKPKKSAGPKETTSIGPVAIVGGMELYSWVPILWALLLDHPFAKSRALLRSPHLPRVKIARNRKHRFSAFAALDQWRVYCSFGPGCDKAEAIETLLHELCHLAMPVDVTGLNKQQAAAKRREENHGYIYRTVLVDTAQRMWGVRVPVEVKKNGYETDDLIVKALRVKWGLPWMKGTWINDEEVKPC